MITLKSEHDLEKMRVANRIVRDVLLLMADNVKVGVSTYHLDKLAREYIYLPRVRNGRAHRHGRSDPTQPRARRLARRP